MPCYPLSLMGLPTNIPQLRADRQMPQLIFFTKVQFIIHTSDIVFSKKLKP